MKPELPGLDRTSTRCAREARTGRNVALTVAAVFAAISAVMVASNTGCEGELEQRVDCQGVPECIDRFERDSTGRVVFNPPAEFNQPFDQCGLLTAEQAAQTPECR